MAYYLKFNGLTNKVTLDTGITIAVGESLEFTGVYHLGDDFNMFVNFYIGDIGDIGADYVAFEPGGFLKTRIDGVIVTSVVAGLAEDDEFIFRLDRTPTEYLFYIDGVLCISYTKSTDADAFRGFGNDSLGVQSANNCDLYTARLYDSGGDIHRWEPPATGTGLVLEDMVGANDGTLVGFAGADAERWILIATVAYSVVVLAGQSNMIGRADIVPGTDDDYTGIGGAKQYGFTAEAIISAVNPLDHNGELAGDMGLWLQFIKDAVIANTFDKPVLFVPVAQGGTSFIGDNWNPGDTQYLAAVARINAAMATDVGNTLDAFLWHQGESDTANASYLADITAMHTGMVSDVTSMTNTTPFIVGKIAGGGTAPQIAAINADLTTFSASLPASGVVETEDQTLSDGLHFNAAGLRTIGGRYLSALSVIEAPVITFPLPLGASESNLVGAVTDAAYSVCSLPSMAQIAEGLTSWGADSIPSFSVLGLVSGTEYNVTIRDDATGKKATYDITAV